MEEQVPLIDDKIATNRFAQYYFTAISNVFSRKISSYVRQAHGIGLSEWRIISNLAHEPDITAAQVSQKNVMDKGLVSREFKSLLSKGLIEVMEKETGGRNNRARLTQKGIGIHNAIRPFVIEQYSLLMAGVSPEEEDALFNTLNKLMTNLEKISEGV